MQAHSSRGSLSCHQKHITKAARPQNKLPLNNSSSSSSLSAINNSRSATTKGASTTTTTTTSASRTKAFKTQEFSFSPPQAEASFIPKCCVMYGLINKAIEDVIVKLFGPDIWQKVKERTQAILQSESTVCPKTSTLDSEWLLTKSYPDQVTFALVTASTEVLGASTHKLLELFGHGLFGLTVTNLGPLLELTGRSFGEFISNTNKLHTMLYVSHTHTQSSLEVRIAKVTCFCRGTGDKTAMPILWCTSMDEKKRVVIFHYRPGKKSRTGLASLVVGLLRGTSHTILFDLLYCSSLKELCGSGLQGLQRGLK